MFPGSHARSFVPVYVLFEQGSSVFACAHSLTDGSLQFLYYLYDRFWGRPAEEWQGVVRDYCTAFHLPEFFRVECLVFFLLDNDTPEALQVSLPGFTSSAYTGPAGPASCDLFNHLGSES